MFPFLQAAEELGCAIFVHPWDMELKGRMSKYWLPWLVGELYFISMHCRPTVLCIMSNSILFVGMPAETAQAICCMIFGGVLERYPNLKVCFAHGGKQNK